MKSIAIGLFLVLLLLFFNSCDLTNPNDSEHYLKGTIKDSNGNVITDASVYIVFDIDNSEERDSSFCLLSSFTATETAQHFVALNWVTLNESNLMGFNLYRSAINDISNSSRINPVIITATNTSQDQAYSFSDNEVTQGSWYYWLEAITVNGESIFWGPNSITLQWVDPPVIPTVWLFQNAYPNPTDSYTTLSFSVPVASHISIKFRSAYLGEVRTLCDEILPPGIHRMVWNGKDNNDIKVCNGVYQAEFIATSATDSIRFRKTIDILVNDVGTNNLPAVLSTSSGYRISLEKYFKFGQQIVQTDQDSNELGYFEISGDFQICIKKEGYETVTRHVSLSSFTHDCKEDFILYPSKK